MRAIAFSVACSAWTVLGRRVQLTSDQLRRHPKEVQHTADIAGDPECDDHSTAQLKHWSTGQVLGHDASDVFATLLAPAKPAAAWQVGGIGRELGTSSCERNTRSRSAVSMKRYVAPSSPRSTRRDSPSSTRWDDTTPSFRKGPRYKVSFRNAPSSDTKASSWKTQSDTRAHWDDTAPSSGGGLRYKVSSPNKPSFDNIATPWKTESDTTASRRKGRPEDEEIDPEKWLDLFGTGEEWKARGDEKKWKRYQRSLAKDKRDTDVEDDEHLGATSKIDDGAPPKWDVEVTGQRSATFFSPYTNFVELGASEELQEALESIGVERPSRVQGAGFAPIFDGEDVMLADQTGSGKTIAYLAPIIEKLRKLEESSGRTPKRHVRAIVIAPTSELAQQVLSVAKSLSRAGVPFRSSVVTGEHDWRNQVSVIKQGAELLVFTPGRLLTHLEAGTFSLDLISHIVLDEADLLFEDDGFPRVWEFLREHVPDSAATAFVTATLPNWLISLVRMDLPLVKIRKGKNLHITAAGVTETLVDCSGGLHLSYTGEEGFKVKTIALVNEMAKHPADRVLVFCNTIESARKVENYLRRRDRRGKQYEVSSFHGAIDTTKRKEIMARFLSEEDVGIATPRVLVCTDRASRGIDFRLVRHVILFDYPRDGVEYVRRVGRATRGTGAPGHVTSLLLGRQVQYAKELMRVNREGRPVSLDVHGSRETAPEGYTPKKKERAPEGYKPKMRSR